MHQQRAETKRRIKASKEIMAQAVPIFRSMVSELRGTGKISKASEMKLRCLSNASRKLYPPRIVLMLMERASKAGYKKASTDALLFCEKEKVPVPRWALTNWAQSQRSGPEKKDGRPALHPWVVAWRVLAVERCAKQPKYGRDRQGDKYERAHRLLETTNPCLFAGLPIVVSAAAVKKTYHDFRRSRRLGYISPEFFKGLLQGMVLSSLTKGLRQRN
jgi:hypothetical protein